MAEEADESVEAKLERLLGYVSALSDLFTNTTRVIVAEYDDALGAGEGAALRIAMGKRELQPIQWAEAALREHTPKDRSAAFREGYLHIADRLRDALGDHVLTGDLPSEEDRD